MNKMGGTEEKTVKTIALLCTALNARGGTSQDILNIYQKINRERFRVLIAYCSTQKSLLEEFFLEGGVKRSDLFYFPADKKILFIPLIIRLKRLFSNEDVDILHTFFLHSDIIGFFAASLAGIKCLISTVHGKFLWDEINGVNKTKQGCYKSINAFIRKYFYKTITVSRELAQEVQSYHVIENSKIITIPVGIDIPSEKEAQINSDAVSRKPIVIATVCRFSKDKGLHYLLGAASYVTAKIASAQFVIVGEGEQERELKQAVAEAGLGSWVIFPGRIENIANFFKGIDIFAMTSIREGCPVALLEALSFAKPVVAFASPGVKEIITDGENGILVNPFDVEAFGAALLELCNNRDYARRLGINGRRCVQEKYSVEKEVSRIEQLYLGGLSIQSNYTWAKI